MFHSINVLIIILLYLTLRRCSEDYRFKVLKYLLGRILHKLVHTSPGNHKSHQASGNVHGVGEARPVFLPERENRMAVSPVTSAGGGLI